MSWCSSSLTEIQSQVKTNFDQGLTAEEARRRLVSDGLNQLTEKPTRNPFLIFLDQFKDFIVWVLLAAALISGLLQEWIDFLAILAIVILNGLLGFIQEYRAERSIQALKKMSVPSAKVRRDGRMQVVPVPELVRGDILIFEAGDHISADSRLIQAFNLKIQEASLTGESTPVEKKTNLVLPAETSIGDRSNMIFMGTSVIAGKGEAVIVDTAMQTEFGKIAELIQEAGQEQTPLQKQLEQFGRWLVYICFGVVALVFILHVLHGQPILDMFLSAVSLAVAAIPEGLPAIVTITLALGIQRMAKRHALIRKLPSVETLGCTTVICSDKTGTLTQNEMMVVTAYINRRIVTVSGRGYEPKGNFESAAGVVYPAEEIEFRRALEIAGLCNNASLEFRGEKWSVIGDPTEGALLSVTEKAGLTREQFKKDFRVISEIPFDSDRKRMTVIVESLKNKSERYAFVKGAPDVILSLSHRVLENGNETALDSSGKQRWHNENLLLTRQALRVLAVAFRKLPSQIDISRPDLIEQELVITGFFGMKDPARPEVKEAVRLCKKGGVRPVMITGDHRNTAVAIASELGMFEKNSIALSGEELDQMSESELDEQIQHVSVFARVSAEHKLNIVRSLRRQKEVVAMTGDGVNDAPAVKEADIGVAMGITGTDVTKEAADMVITDDNFSSIVSAVEEGRGIYDNIRKSIFYLLSCNSGEVLVMFVTGFFGFPIPLLPVQILWVNLVTDGFPALALGMDPVDPQIMERPVREPNAPMISSGQIFSIFAQGALIALCTLAAFCFVLFAERAGDVKARSMAFMVLSCSQLFHSLNCRNDRKSIFEIALFSNSKLILGVLISLILQLAVIYLPFCQVVFKTETLTLLELGCATALSIFPFVAMEIYKRLRR